MNGKKVRKKVYKKTAMWIWQLKLMCGGNCSMTRNKGQGNTRGAGRSRNWTFVVYPESVMEGWRDVLDDIHIQWVESPLHDKDTNADGEPKKEHYHVLLIFESVKSYDQVLEITDSIQATVPQKCMGNKGLVRYMAHLDNPEKYQYSKSDIIGHGGVDVMELLRPTSADRYALLREMTLFIIEHDIREYEDLWLYAMENRFDDWFPLLADNGTFAINNFIKSRRYKRESG